MPGTVHDGHEFVDAAFAAGAAGAIVSQAGRRPARAGRRHRSRRSQALGRASRERSSATIIGVTGSVGKTSTKEALYAALDRCRAGQGPSLGQELQQPHRRAAEPGADAARRRVRGVRNGHEQCRRDRRADPRWSARTSRSSPRSPRRTSRISARRRRSPTPRRRSSRGSSPAASRSSPTTRRIATGWSRPRGAMPSGSSPSAAAMPTCTRSMRCAPSGGGSLISAALARARADLHHRAARRALGDQRAGRAGRGRGGRRATSRVAGLALADMGGLKGRGERHRLAGRRRRGAADRRELQRQSGVDGGDAEEPRRGAATSTRRIAVLGPMRELGEHSDELHAGLAPAVLDAHVDELILVGEEMRAARRAALVGKVSLDLVADVDEATDALLRACVRPGDAVLVKASNSVGLAEARRARGRGARHALPDRRTARLPGRPQPHPLHQLPRRRGERDRAGDRPAARPVVHLLAARHARARASRSAPTARRATSPSAARRPWAGC